MNKQYVLEKLKEILDDPNIKTGDRLKAIKLAGDYLKMFNSKVEVDSRILVANLTNKELQGLTNARRLEGDYPNQISNTVTIDIPAIESGSDGF